MSRILPAKRLNFVAQAGKQQIENWKEGVSLSDDSGCSISELLRFAAAESMKADADLLLSRSREYLRSKGCKL